ncbi:MAG: hypothetical protein ABIQ18_35520 [Umezawaea sp.]
MLAALNSAYGKGVRQTPEAAVALIRPALPRDVVDNGDPTIVCSPG